MPGTVVISVLTVGSTTEVGTELLLLVETPVVALDSDARVDSFAEDASDDASDDVSDDVALDVTGGLEPVGVLASVGEFPLDVGSAPHPSDNTRPATEAAERWRGLLTGC
jgi:hypothetical protein